MKRLLWLIVCLMTMVISASAQGNIVMDEIISSEKEPVGQKFDDLVLYPNKSIKENYELIKKRMSLHRERNYAEYTICCKGRYSNKKGQVCIADIEVDGMIKIKGNDNERYRTISGQIIRALVGLYTQSLDRKFDISPDEHQSCWGACYSTCDVAVATISTNYGVSGGVYVKKRLPGHLIYKIESMSWNGPSLAWRKVYNKVIEETGLKDGGEMYELDIKLGLQ